MSKNYRAALSACLGDHVDGIQEVRGSIRLIYESIYIMR